MYFFKDQPHKKMKSIFLLCCLFVGTTVLAQNMTNEKLEEVFTSQVDSISGYPGYWEIFHKERQILCITDRNHNRMRIIAPITNTNILDKELLLDALTANFHSALDVKYAISKDILWSVFIHPLKELSEEEVKSAIEQVANAANNFGTTFSSTEMIFGAEPNTNVNDNPATAPKEENLLNNKF